MSEEKETVKLVINETKYRRLENGEWGFNVDEDEDIWLPCVPDEFELLDHIVYLREALKHLGDELQGQLETGTFGRGHMDTIYWIQLISVARNPVEWAAGN